MRKLFLLAIGLAMLVSCTKNDSEDKPVTSTIIRKTTSIQSPTMNQKVTLGTSIDFSILNTDGKIDSVVISGDKFSASFKSSTFSWVPETSRTGRLDFKLSAYSKGKVETHHPRLIMLSDIAPQEMTYSVVQSFPHDANAYTQGLFFLGDDLIESTGQKGESVIKKVKLTTGEALKTTPIGDQYFGEGSTLYKDEIYMVTWTSGTGFVFDTDLNLSRTFQFAYEGWGLTTMGDTILMTHGNGVNGSEKIYYINPADFSEIDHIEAYSHEKEVTNLNEIELVEGLVYANEWQTDNIHVIDPKTGKVLQTIDMTGLLSNPGDADVLNGIAYHAPSKRLFVTGKNWPRIFEITIKPKNNS